MNPRHRRRQHMPRPEDTLNLRKRTLPRRTPPVNPRVPHLIPNTQQVTPGSSPHGRIVALRLHTKVPLIPLHHFPNPIQIYTAVVDTGWGRLKVPD